MLAFGAVSNFARQASRNPCPIDAVGVVLVPEPEGEATTGGTLGIEEHARLQHTSLQASDANQHI